VPQLDVRPIAAAETRWLRHTLLRPHQAPDTLVYPGDDAPDSLHVGTFLNGQLVGIASVTHHPFPGAPGGAGWQLRGIATLPEVRGRGYGAALVQACLEHVSAHGGAILWCNGRTAAQSFYEAMGFQIWGEEFETPHTGPHYVFWREVGP
jgi:GNAT superfamily N-acetyltransferase